MNGLLHVANSLILASFVLKDILWLRLLSVTASTFFITFFYTRPEPLWAGIGWNLLFMSVNLIQIGILFLERRPVYLTEEEQAIHRTLFASLTQQEFAKLLRVADWRDCSEQQQLIVRGEEPDCVLLVSSGGMQVKLSDERVIVLEHCQFAGEMSFLSGECANADVYVLPETRYLCWPKQHLSEVLQKHPNLYATMQVAWSNDLVRKLQTH